MVFGRESLRVAIIKKVCPHYLMSVQSSKREQCLTTIILPLWADLFLPEQYFHQSLISTSSGMQERCSTVIVQLVENDLFPFEW